MEQLQKVSAAFVLSTNNAAPGGLKDVNSRTVVLQLDFLMSFYVFYVIQLQQERRDAELRAKREEEEQRKRREEKRRQQEEQKRREEEELFRRKQVGRSCLAFLIFIFSLNWNLSIAIFAHYVI